MRIDIIITRDDGSTITIGSNQQVVAALPQRVFDCRPRYEEIRSLSMTEAWAASFLCAETALRSLPIDAMRQPLLEAAAAYNKGRGRASADRLMPVSMECGAQGEVQFAGTPEGSAK